jgi:hypothetical protein
MEVRPGRWGENHEEAKAQEGQVGHRDANRGLMTQIDFHADQSPEDEERRQPVRPRGRAGAPQGPRLGRGEANQRGATSRGHAGGDELSGLRGWKKPLKGRTPGAPPV